MLLWIVIALGFVACAVAYHFWQGITWEEAATLFVAAAIVFGIHLQFIYKKATTDEYFVTGYVTSLIHRSPFSYQCGKHRCHEPERWLVEQRPRPPARQSKVVRDIHSGDGTEACFGECSFNYPAPYSGDKCCEASDYAHSIEVSREKFSRITPGDTSVSQQFYFNPVRVSDDIVYDDGEDISYFKFDDYNQAHRLLEANIDRTQEEKLEKLNSDLSQSGISVGIVLTPDPLYFEKLKRAWHQGKSNDFVVVVTSVDGKKIDNVNVLGWNNYTLKENVSEAVMGLPSVDFNSILDAVGKTLRQGPDFVRTDFSHYKFLAVKIPANYYWRILIFQAVFFVYMLTLLRLNPNTKDKKLTWEQVGKMWEKHFTPPNANWNLHPFAPVGLFLYIGVPIGATMILWTF
jgi:hypothetical protein